MSDSAKQEFNNKISRLTKSAAYLNYCEEVYEYRMYLFNMMDRQQLDFIFNDISLCDKDTVLDIGCGYGSILNTLIEKRGCSGIGVDQLSSNYVLSKNKRFKYVSADFNNIDNLNINPTVTLLIDSIYFSSDPQKLICYLHSIKNNHIYLFYSQYLFKDDSADKGKLHGDFTAIAQILKKNGIPYKMIKYSENEKILYDKSLSVLEKMKNSFIYEGN